MKSILLICFLIFSVTSKAQENAEWYIYSIHASFKYIQDVLLKQVSVPYHVPDLLYHWTSAKGLSKMTPSNSDDGAYPRTEEILDKNGKMFSRLYLQSANSLPLVPSYQGQVATKADVAPRFGLYTFDNPIGGLGTTYENYAQYSRVDDSDSGAVRFEAPRVITIKPKPRATFEMIITKSYSGETSGANKIASYRPFRNDETDALPADFIYHVNISRNGSLQFSEWIVVNPNAIKWFTADPSAAKPRVDEELEKLKIGIKYQPKDKVIGSEGLPVGYKTTLRDAMSVSLDKIPSYFAKPFSFTSYRSCKQIFR